MTKYYNQENACSFPLLRSSVCPLMGEYESYESYSTNQLIFVIYIWNKNFIIFL